MDISIHHVTKMRVVSDKKLFLSTGHAFCFTKIFIEHDGQEDTVTLFSEPELTPLDITVVAAKNKEA